MFPYLLALIYIVTAIACGWLGRNTLAGPIGTFILAIILTPLIVFLALIAFMRRPSRARG